MKFKQGDYVKIVDREVTPTDVKSGNYYPYFRGLAGVVDKIYDTEICLKVDPDTLPEKILKRHLEIQESMKRKWLNGLSGEARNRLTPEEKQFNLAYTILVQAVDLEKAKPSDKPKPEAAKSAKQVSAPSPAEAASEEPAPEAEAAPKAEKAPKAADKPDAVTTKDLSAAELAFLKEREEALKNQ
jgi:hypothetical protein